MWRKFLCRIGIHEWETLRVANCKAWHSVFIGYNPHQVESEAHWRKCKHCGIEAAYLTDGMGQWTLMDLGYLKRKMGW